MPSTHFFSWGGIGPPPSGTWILTTGFWVDSGEWIDSDVWID